MIPQGFFGFVFLFFYLFFFKGERCSCFLVAKSKCSRADLRWKVAGGNGGRQCCRSCLLLPSPASAASVASPGLSAHSQLLHSPNIHSIHGEPSILRCPVEQSCSGQAMSSSVPSTAPLPQGGTRRVFCTPGTPGNATQDSH